MNPNDNITAPNTNQDQGNLNPTPNTDVGSLNFVPANPETGETIIYEVPKVTPETTQEKLINEVIAQPPSIPQLPKENSIPTITTPITPTTPPKIVDNTKNITKLHHLEHSVDKLTSIADDEEEKFITEVEAAHGHK